MSHPHNDKAFPYAQKVLNYCQAEGIAASARLYFDGSGELLIHQRQITQGQREHLENMLHSNRWEPNQEGMALKSCCGWHE